MMKAFKTTKSAVLVTGLAVMINLMAQWLGQPLLIFPAVALAVFAIIICFRADKEDMKLVRRMLLALNIFFVGLTMFFYMLIQAVGQVPQGL